MTLNENVSSQDVPIYSRLWVLTSFKLKLQLKCYLNVGSQGLPKDCEVLPRRFQIINFNVREFRVGEKVTIAGGMEWVHLSENFLIKTTTPPSKRN